MATASKVLKYPQKAPVAGSYLEGPDQPTGRIDYLKIQRYRINYANESGYGGENLPSNEVQRQLGETVCYINMPQQIQTAYSANYSTANMGAGGVLATQLVGQLGGAAQGRSLDADRIKQQLKSAAAAAMPEFAYKLGANAINAIPGGLAGGAGDASTLQALSSGRIMNPFTEQVFTGVGFRSHSFSFKMFAKNQSEAKEILGIIAYLKQGVMPKYGEANMKELEGLLKLGESALTGGGGEGDGTTESTSAIDLSSFTNSAAYLEVPDRFLLEFVRLDPTTSTIQSIPHYKMQPCICTNFQVNYTPDGQYVSFKDAIIDLQKDSTTGAPKQLFVPAVEINMEFTETKILTQVDAAAGF